VNKRHVFKKSVAWLLIAALVNPALIAPAYARDSDIYQLVSGLVTAAEPNVMFIVGTNDRMNTAEAWREYPGAYDSHAEYLWNDVNIIGTVEQTTESGNLISDASPPVNPFSPWGTWSGTLTSDRKALWQATLAYAQGTQAGDPGPRSMFRNYFNDSSWLYWLPAGTANTDLRLSSVSFNRFRAGPANYVSGTRGGVVFPPTGPTTPYNYTTINNYSAYNMCSQTNATATSPLVASTIMAPTTAPQNAGVWLNQQWIRWEPYINLATLGNGGYPGSSTNYNALGYAQGYLDASIALPANSIAALPLVAGNTPNAGPPYRDSTGAGPTGSQGQPIRLQMATVTNPSDTTGNRPGISYAGWQAPYADLGGYVFQSAVINGLGATGYPYSCTVAGATCTLAGNYGVLQAVLSWYGLTTQIGGSWPFTAWKGNRDLAPTFDMRTGTHAYYDTTTAPCNSSTGPNVATTCVPVASGAVAAQNYTLTQACKYNAGWSEYDANGTQRFGGGNCAVSGLPGCSDPRYAPCTGAAGTGVVGSACMLAGGCNGVAAPGCGTPVAQTTFYDKVVSGACSWTGPTTLTVNTCTWTGRSNVYIEGQGYYYYGGTCTESGDAVITNGASRSCSISGVSTVTLNGTSQPFVYGPITSAQFTAGTYVNTGCSNSIAAGSYKYGGTCTAGTATQTTVPPGTATAGGWTAASRPNYPTASTNTYKTTGAVVPACAFTAGTSLTIRGTTPASPFFNPTCGTSDATINQTCSTRYAGVNCDNYGGTFASLTPAPVNSSACPQATTTGVAIAGTGATTTYYQAYKPSASTSYLYHECIADNGTGGNPGSGYPTNYIRTLNTAFNTNTTANPATGLTQAYVTGGTGRMTNPNTAIDVYSVNYLNWLNGAKACRDSSGNLLTAGPIGTPPAGATCTPIARKTRLQVAKDALSGLIQTTDGVRLGLMVYNKTQSCTSTDGSTSSTTGTISSTTNPNQLTVVDPTQFVVGATVSVVGAGNAGGTIPLTTTISSIVGSVLTLGANALHDENNVAVTAMGLLNMSDPTRFTAGSAITVVGAGPAAANLNTTVSSISGNVYVLAAAASTQVTNTVVQANPCTGGNVDDGGNVQYAIRRMGSNVSDPDYANRATLISAIQSVVASSRTPLTETMYEAYRYFAGRTPKWGTSNLPAAVGTVSAGYDPSVGPDLNAPSPGAQATVTLRASAAGVYNSPMLNNPDLGPANAADPAHPGQFLKGPASCQKNYIVMITNGQPEDDASANTDVKSMQWTDPTLLPSITMVTSPNTSLNTNGPAGSTFNQIPTVSGGNPFGPTDAAGTGSDGGYIWLDELTYFMANADVSPGEPNGLPGDVFPRPSSPIDPLPGRQSIVTYTIGFAGVNAPVVQNAAQDSSGVYYVAQNAQQLQAALQAAFVAITNWNPTAASATVPISSLNRGQSSTDIYLAFFGPQPASTWTGTVKKYQLGTDTTTCGAGISLCLIGQTLIASNGNYNIETIDPVSGQSIVDPTAVSGPNCDIVPPSTVCKPPGSNSAWQPITVQDGSLPNSGGTGYDLINTAGYTPVNRKLYTFLPGISATTDLTAIGNSVTVGNAAITPAMIGAVPASQHDTLINFIRGADSSGTAWATWPHFDVQHSTPAIVTYDSTQNPPIQYLFYVQNNGMLTAVDAHTGQEVWSFLVDDALPQLSAMYANVNGPEQYIADGTPAVFLDDHYNAAIPANTNGDGIINGTDRVWIYFGLRRGGRSYYALDVTNINAPIFKWKITGNGGSGQLCLNAAGCSATTEYNELGQTWSTPAVGRIRKYPALLDPPAVIFGGGYDTAEDSIPPAARTMGRALYVVNGDTGAVIESWGVGQFNPGYKGGGGQLTTYSIPSDVTAVNSDNDAQGFLDRVYVGDMGGDVWRFDIDNADPTQWQGEQLASLSNAAGEKRKFFFAPAVVPQVANVGTASLTFDAVYIGSGDKEHPLDTQTTTPAVSDDKIFMLMDDPSLVSGGGTPTIGSPSGNATPITPASLLSITDTSTTGVPAASLGNPGVQGWMRALDPGEKVINSPTVFFNHLRFGTYAPSGQVNLCTPGGVGRLNDIASLTGDFFTINPGPMNATQRYYSSFLTRGYVSSGQLLVIGQNIYHIVVSDARLQSLLVGTIGAASKVYWYMEPEQ